LSRRELTRSAASARPAAPVRLVHLGLGNFFRAHQAWYTDRAPDAEDWGIAAFTGRTRGLTQELTAQDGLYTLVTRAADGDRFEPIESLSRVYAAEDHNAWLSHLSSPDVRAVTLTVTEAGYPRDAGGGLDRNAPEVIGDVETLRRDRTGLVRTAPGRLLSGIAARHRAGVGQLTIVPCDNLPDNGAVIARLLRDMAELIDTDLTAWLEQSVSTIGTVVDRITPRVDTDDLLVVAQATGLEDRAPVVTEPFSEWVLGGTFPSGRPRWEEAGAIFTDDVAPFQQRKLWLLNGGHSLLAYAGSVRGHATVAEAMADDDCREWLEQWWDEASPYLDLSATQIVAYRAALIDRLANPRIHHRLDQIAADGSQKLPVRIVPVVRRERSARRVPQGAIRVLAAWICHLRGLGAPVEDVNAAKIISLASGPLPDAVRRVVDTLDLTLGADPDIIAGVLEHTQRFERQARPRG
jgi:fructuronate reductase